MRYPYAKEYMQGRGIHISLPIYEKTDLPLSVIHHCMPIDLELRCMKSRACPLNVTHEITSVSTKCNTSLYVYRLEASLYEINSLPNKCKT